MKSRTRLRTLPKGTSERTFADLVAFVFPLVMPIRAIDMTKPVH